MLKLGRKSLIGLAIVGVNIAAITLPFSVTADSQTTDTAIGLTVNSVIISYSSGPTVTLGAITPDSTGRQSTSSDTVTADTNDTNGLNITLKAASAVSTNMASGANTIATGAGTPAAPAALPNGRWGWRMDSLAGFGAGPTSTIAGTTPSAITYAGIPVNASPYTIKTTVTNGSTSNTVWYSARVNSSQPVGAYTTSVTYTIATN